MKNNEAEKRAIAFAGGFLIGLLADFVLFSHRNSEQNDEQKESTQQITEDADFEIIQQKQLDNGPTSSQ